MPFRSIVGLLNNLIHDKSFKYNSENNYLNQDLSSILTPDENPKLLDEGLVQLRLHIAKNIKMTVTPFLRVFRKPILIVLSLI